MWEWSVETALAAWSAVDPRCRKDVRVQMLAATQPGQLPLHGHVAFIGQRAAGKSTLLRALAAASDRAAFDLDACIESQHGMGVAELFAQGEPAFRAAERNAFARLEAPSLVACGGGFASHHADLLVPPHVPVLVPVSWDTYCQRLRANMQRPRLLPHLTLDQELEQVFARRQFAHQMLPGVWTLGRFFAAVGLPAEP